MPHFKILVQAIRDERIMYLSAIVKRPERPRTLRWSTIEKVFRLNRLGSADRMYPTPLRARRAFAGPIQHVRRTVRGLELDPEEVRITIDTKRKKVHAGFARGEPQK